MNSVNKKIILGIDPGTARMGYGIIQDDGSKIVCVDFGVISTPSSQTTHMRLKYIYEKLTEIILKHKPDAVGVEDIFYYKNQKTIVQVAAARGIALLAGAQNNKEVFSFTPLQVKQAVTGYGQADKKQVQEMVKLLLKLKSIPKPDDAADALGVAICCAYSLTMLRASYSNAI